MESNGRTEMSMPIDRGVVELLTVPASVHDAQGRFVYMNAAAEEASGFTNAKMVGKTLFDPLPPEAREHVRAQFERALTGEPIHFETVFVDGEGRLRGVRAQHLPLRDGEEIVGVLILAFDVRVPISEDLFTNPPRLTRREREILELLASGRTTEDIAGELVLSVATIRNHIRSLLHKLNAHTRVAAIANAQRLGLLETWPLRQRGI